MVPGLVLIVVGLILIVAPYPLVAVGARYRRMGTLPQAAAVRAARIAATVLVVVGLVVIAAT